MFCSLRWMLATQVCSVCENLLSHRLDLCTFLCDTLCDISMNTSMYIARKGIVFQCMDFLVQISNDLLTSSMAPGKLLNFCVNSVSSLVQKVQ